MILYHELFGPNHRINLDKTYNVQKRVVGKNGKVRWVNETYNTLLKNAVKYILFQKYSQMDTEMNLVDFVNMRNQENDKILAEILG